MKNLIIFPLYVLYFVINYILLCIYKYEAISESNKNQIREMLNLLLENIQPINKKYLRFIIKKNRFTNNMTYIMNYTHNGKKLVLKKSVNNYILVYKGKVIKFTEENKHVFKSEWERLNPSPITIFEA